MHVPCPRLAVRHIMNILTQGISVGQEWLAVKPVKQKSIIWAALASPISTQYSKKKRGDLDILKIDCCLITSCHLLTSLDSSRRVCMSEPQSLLQSGSP